ncbi:MAG: protein kinase domain-containing protein [Wenzhouxiangella sp.]
MTGDAPNDLPTQLEALIQALPGDEPRDWARDWSLDQFSLVRTLGRGGMGQVFLARQHHPVERDVALKVIHHKVSTPLNLARFELERQTLARMSHPAIAQVFDAGTTPSGYPWFAMEYIEGERLDHYCAGQRLPIRQRLELFVRICRGVQHAHQKGVVHRDLKPGNILVTEVDGLALPRIIDFGIATSNDAAREQAAVGTPQYMSPEQLDPSLGDVDTRSDVYALGVILHELLVDQPPLGRAVYQEPDTTTLAARLVANQPLPAPSVTLSRNSDQSRRLAERRRMSPGSLRRSLRGDLDAITLKALAADKDQRYASAGDLAADIERMLSHHPVTARPATGWYRSQRFARRHALALGSASVITLALLAGLGAALFGMLEAQRQFELAQQRQAELERVSSFQQSMLEQIDIPDMGSGLVVAIRAQADSAGTDAASDLLLSQLRGTDLARGMVGDYILEPARQSIERDFQDQPLLQANLLQSLWEVYNSMGGQQPLVELAERIIELRSRHLPEDDLSRLHARDMLGRAFYDLGDYEQASAVLRQLVEDLHHYPGADYQRARLGAQIHLANVLVDSRANSEAIDLANATFAEAEAHLEALDSRRIDSLSGRGYVRIRSGDIEGALADFQALLQARSELYPPADRRVLHSRINVGAVLGAAGRFEDALELDQETFQLSAEHLGLGHPQTQRLMNNIAAHKIHLNRIDEAADLLEETLALRTETSGALHIETLRTRLNLGSLSIRLGDYERAYDLLNTVWQERLRQLGRDHRDTLLAQELMSDVLLKLDQPGRAYELIREVFERRREQMGAEHAQTATAAHYLGQALIALDRPGEALGYLQMAAEQSLDHPDAEHAPSLRRRLNYVSLLTELERCDEAAAFRAAGLATIDHADELPDNLAELREELNALQHCDATDNDRSNRPG